MELTGKKKWIIAAGTVAAVVVVGCIAYWGMAQKYQSVFFPNTIINGLNVSNCTVEQVQQQIASNMDGYILSLEEREGGQESLQGIDFDLHPEYDGSLEQILLAQNILEWGKGLLGEINYTIETMLVYDEEKLKQEVQQLQCFNTTAADQPKDAYLSDYIEGVGYQVIPDEPGKIPEETLLMAAVTDAIMNMKTSVSLEEAGVYKKATIQADDEALNAEAAMWNGYTDTTVTYKFGDKTEVLDGSITHTWLLDDGNGGVTLDEALIGEYVAELAKKYNTAYAPKQLKTSYGPTVTITKGNYGWRINQSAEAAALLQIIQSMESQEREPVYSQTAASHGENDYGDTYVEMNLSGQHLFFYKNGTLVVESDFVSGNASRGWSTPAGAYPLTYKQKDATLKGEGYATPVSYWMPFNGGIGMHDASWRGSFGGKIYKTNGSHGCINLPKSVAKTIFENISAGVPILCYHLDSTESGTTSTPAATAAAQPVTQPVPPTTAPVETTPATETVPQTQEETSSVETTGADFVNEGPGATAPAATQATQPEEPAGTTTEAVAETTVETVPAETSQGPDGPQPQPQPQPQPESESQPQPQTQPQPDAGTAASQGGVNEGPGM